MAPALNTPAAGGKLSFLPSSSHRKPITTREKQEAAAAAEAKRKAQVLSPSPDIDDPDKPAKKRKMKCMPPPDEIAEAAQSKAERTSVALSKSRKKPVTTKEKIEEAKRLEIASTVDKKLQYQHTKEKRLAKKAEQTKKEAEAKDGNQKTEGDDKVKTESFKKPAKKAKTQELSAFTLMGLESETSVVRYEDKKRKTGVLYGPTARAKEDRGKIDAELAKAPSQPQRVLKIGQKQPEEKPFRVMDLPKEIRRKVWKEVVVHHPICVWPSQPKGKEQPDLCMTSRAVRNEVLPIFYGGNTFAFDITPSERQEHRAVTVADVKMSELGDNKNGGEPPASTIPKPKSARSEPKPAIATTIFDPIPEIKRWARAMESGGHLKKIQHWLFSSMPETIVPPIRIPRLDEANSVAVHVCVWQDSIEVPEIVQDPSRDETSESTPLMWRTSVEIHHEAICVLPKNPLYKRCMVQLTPEWVNRVVGVLLRQVERDGGVSAEMVARVAEIFRERADDLVEHRCEMQA